MLKMCFIAAGVVFLAGCQSSSQQVARERAALTCLSAGFGETSPRHDECMRTVGAVALQDERRRRIQNSMEGLDLVARGLRGPAIE